MNIRKAAAGCFMAAALVCSASALTSCGALSTVTTIFKVGKKVKKAKKAITMIGSILGQYKKTTSKSSLVGSWAYQMPSVQFDSEKSLASAGGVEGSQQLAEQLSSSFSQMGLKTGKVSLTLNSDNSAVYNIGGKTFNGSYSYDDTSKKITLKYGLISLPAAYLSVDGDEMAMTFDSSKINSLALAAGLAGNNKSATAVSELTSGHDGMKTGLSFIREQ